jgi:transcriptional regulator with XRE-family HTH domain
MSIIEKITYQLSQRGVTANKMMKELGFSNGLFSQWKKGLQKPSAEKIKAIADYLGVTVDYLVYDDTSTNRNPNTEITENGTINIVSSSISNSSQGGNNIIGTSDTTEFGKVIQPMIEKLSNTERAELMIIICRFVDEHTQSRKETEKDKEVNYV